MALKDLEKRKAYDRERYKNSDRKNSQRAACIRWRKNHPHAHAFTSYEKKAALVEYKGGCCRDCHGVFPLCCYDFDHLPQFDKSFEICRKLQNLLDDLKTEADKCDLVCANCHRIRTTKRLGVTHARD